MEWIPDIELIGTLLGHAVQSQVAQFSFSFGLAAWIHSGRVKKEIAAQLSGIKDAVKDLSAALRQDLEKQSERIGKLEDRVGRIEPKQNILGG